MGGQDRDLKGVWEMLGGGAEAVQGPCGRSRRGMLEPQEASVAGVEGHDGNGQEVRECGGPIRQPVGLCQDNSLWSDGGRSHWRVLSRGRAQSDRCLRRFTRCSMWMVGPRKKQRGWSGACSINPGAGVRHGQGLVTF